MAESRTPEDLNIERITTGADRNAERDRVRPPSDSEQEIGHEKTPEDDGPDEDMTGHTNEPIDPDSAFSENDRDDTVDE